MQRNAKRFTLIIMMKSDQSQTGKLVADVLEAQLYRRHGMGAERTTEPLRNPAGKLHESLRKLAWQDVRDWLATDLTRLMENKDTNEK